MSQQKNQEDLELILGPVDDPVLELLDQPTEDAELEPTQEEALRQQVFFGDPPQTQVPLAEQESLLEDPVVLAALMDEAL